MHEDEVELLVSATEKLVDVAMRGDLERAKSTIPALTSAHRAMKIYTSSYRVSE